MRVPAVVGSFPEPFLSGSGGKRIPVRIDCAEDARRECREVRERVEAAGVEGGGRDVGSTGAGVLRLLVGRWPDIRADPPARAIERGPGLGRVRPAGRGRGAGSSSSTRAGRRGARSAPGAGLVAATAGSTSSRPGW